MNLKLLCIALVAGGSVFLSPTLLSAELKIGVASIQRLNNEAAQAQAASEMLSAEFGERQSELIAEQREVEKLKAKLDAATDPLEVPGLAKSLQTRQQSLQRTIQQYEGDLKSRRVEAIEKLSELILAEIKAFAREEKFDLLLIDGVLHASEQVDVTDAILQRLKLRSSEN
jgi:outer membrane protein